MTISDNIVTPLILMYFAQRFSYLRHQPDFKCKYNFSDIFPNKKQNKTLPKSIKYQFSQTSRVEATAVLPDVVGLALDLIPAEVHVS